MADIRGTDTAFTILPKRTTVLRAKIFRMGRKSLSLTRDSALCNVNCWSCDAGFSGDARVSRRSGVLIVDRILRGESEHVDQESVQRSDLCRGGCGRSSDVFRVLGRRRVHSRRSQIEEQLFNYSCRTRRSPGNYPQVQGSAHYGEGLEIEGTSRRSLWRVFRPSQRTRISPDVFRNCCNQAFSPTTVVGEMAIFHQLSRYSCLDQFIRVTLMPILWWQGYAPNVLRFCQLDSAVPRLVGIDVDHPGLSTLPR